MVLVGAIGWGSWEKDSDFHEEVYWVVLLGTSPVRVTGAGLGREKSSCLTAAAKSSVIPTGGLELNGPLKTLYPLSEGCLDFIPTQPQMISQQMWAAPVKGTENNLAENCQPSTCPSSG